MRTIVTSTLFGLLLVAGTAHAQARKDSPVERPIAGDMGLSFAFKGLAPMSVGGVGDGLAISAGYGAEVGFRYMLKDDWVLPVSFGMTMLNVSPAGADSSNTLFGLGTGVGIQRYFRTWRRIAPFVGAKLHIGYVNPPGDDSWVLQFAIGPSLGVEYFIADRVSLSMEYNFLFSVQVEGDRTSAQTPGAVGGTAVGLGTALWMGGQMTLSFYF